MKKRPETRYLRAIFRKDTKDLRSNRSGGRIRSGFGGAAKGGAGPGRNNTQQKQRQNRQRIDKRLGRPCLHQPDEMHCARDCHKIGQSVQLLPRSGAKAPDGNVIRGKR